MKTFSTILALFLLCFVSAGARAEDAKPVAEWNFDDGRGAVARDATGNGHDAQLHGASWVKEGDGYALRFDGVDDYADCGDSPSLDIAGPVTVEAWVKPLDVRLGGALAGKSHSQYLLIYSDRGICWWFTGTGSYSVGGKIPQGEWSHVLGSFDGKKRRVWINGRLAGCDDSEGSKAPGGKFLLGSVDGPHFDGLLDNVRVYDRALSHDEAAAHFKKEAGQFGFDSKWFEQARVTPYYYFDEGEIEIVADYRGLQPLRGTAHIDVKLVNQSDQKTILSSKTIDSLPDAIEPPVGGWASNPGVAEVRLPFENQPTGTYAIQVTFSDDRGELASDPITFDYPIHGSLPAPSEQSAAAAQPPAAPVAFQFALGAGGGFQLTINDVVYPFHTRVSWPNGDFNTLAAGGNPSSGEPKWKVETQPATGSNRHEATASGASYTIHRAVEVFPTHVSVSDTYTNTTREDLGLLIYNETPMPDEHVVSSRLNGYRSTGQMVEMPTYGGASVFVADNNAGLGIVPMDDVYVVQSITYVEKNAAGLGTKRFALAPGASYTLKWAIYPTGSKDYYDFVNTFRKVENRIGTVGGGPGFTSFGPLHRRQVPDEEFMTNRGIDIGIISCLSDAADDREANIEGIEFMDFPKEMELIKRQTAALKRKYPYMKNVLHVAHSLYATKTPERFADSRVIRADGVASVSGNPPYPWHVFYPAPGNSFHDAMMRSVDVMMDEMGLDGAFMDGFMLGYGGAWTYDGRWDGHSADIDPETKTIQRKVSSVLLLQQPSMIEFARKMRDKGGIIIANGVVLTPSVAEEKYIYFDAECQAGPECHLAPSVMALANPPFNTETELYHDMLDKLSWGALFIFYNERIPLTRMSLAAKQFPMTFEEIRSGLVRGPQRIVTMNPGSYGWHGKSDLHQIFKFDQRGSIVPNDFITTVDSEGVRTELKFGKYESAVIEPIPASLQSASPVNVRVLKYGDNRLHMLVNGQGDATLDLFVGTSYPDWRDGVFTNGGVHPSDVNVGDKFNVTINGQTTTIEERDGTLQVPMTLDGQLELSIEPHGENS